MAVPVAVIDPLPVYRRGIAAILADHRLDVHTPTDVVVWACGRRYSLVLLSLLSASDWDVLGTLCRSRPQPLVIAVTTDDNSGEAGARAVRLGARSVLPRQSTENAVERAVIATIAGESIMPAAVASILSTGRQQVSASREALSAEQLGWLRDLSRGRTVAGLAMETGYSERAMYRLLRAVYERLGVRTRVEAIVRVQEAGWLGDDVSSADPPDTAG